MRDLAAFTYEAGSPPPEIDRPSEGSGWLRQVDDRTPLLSEVITGRARGRVGPDEITFFSNNEGTGVQFAAMGHVILSQLQTHGAEGVRQVPLDWFLQDIPN